MEKMKETNSKLRIFSKKKKKQEIGSSIKLNLKPRWTEFEDHLGQDDWFQIRQSVLGHLVLCQEHNWNL